MALSYEEIVEAVRQLPADEHERLRRETTRSARQKQPSGAAYVAFLDAMGPLDPEIADEMERIIEEQFEHVDARD